MSLNAIIPRKANWLIDWLIFNSFSLLDLENIYQAEKRCEPTLQKGCWNLMMFSLAFVWHLAFLMSGGENGQASSLIFSGYWTFKMETSIRGTTAGAAERESCSQLSNSGCGLHTVTNYSSY